MSLLFSVIKAVGINGNTETIYESGCPDEYDLQELLTYERRYDPLKRTAAGGGSIHVRHYRFRAGGRNWLAERDHFALIGAYEELAQRHGEPGFTARDDVMMLKKYQIRLQ